MKKYLYLAVLSGLFFASCNKEEAVSKPDESKGATSVKRDGQGPQQPQEPLRVYDNWAGDCCDLTGGNCAPDDVLIFGEPPTNWLMDWINWFTKDATKECSVGPVDIRWSSPVPYAPIFRTHEYDNILRTNFSRLGIKTQAQLDGLDNETFYKVLFPDLTDAQRVMLYSRNYNTMLGRNKNGKSFIFIAPKDKTTLQEAYANLTFVIPFTLRTR